MGKSPIIITGANGSIGFEATRGMLKRGKSVIMACRNIEKAVPLKHKLEEEFPQSHILLKKIDLSDFQSVIKFADELKAEEIKPSGLLNNAGIINREFSLTADGYENSIQVNFLSVALLINILTPIMQPKSVIVNTISVTRKLSEINKNIFIADKNKFRQLGTYSESKLALLYYTAQLASRKCNDFRINATDPGIVDSDMITMGKWYDPLADIFFRPFIKSPAEGARPAINALLSNNSMQVFFNGSSKKISEKYYKNKNSIWLWHQTNDIIKDILS